LEVIEPACEYTTFHIPWDYSSVWSDILRDYSSLTVYHEDLIRDYSSLWSSLSLNKPHPCPRVSVAACTLKDYGRWLNSQATNSIGIPIHSHCWTLVERTKSHLVDNYLEKLTNILYKRWETKCFTGISKYIKIDESCKYWDATFDRFDLPRELELLTKDPIGPRDVRPLLTASVREAFRNPRPRVWRARDHQHPPLILYRNLPIEIIYSILDHIHSADTFTALADLGWRIPNSYWRGRIPRQVLFEFNAELSAFGSSAKKMDWMIFCLKVEELLETSLYLLNRQRILRIAKDIRAMMIGKRDTTAMLYAEQTLRLSTTGDLTYPNPFGFCQIPWPHP
jgi:hypothetical protein